MIYIVQNFIPILAATVSGLLVGLAAYPAVRSRPEWWVTAFVAEFWFTAILAGALILAPPKASPWVMAIGTAIVIWLGFVGPALVVTLRARGTTAGAVVRDCAHWLVVMVVEAVVLHAIGLTAPPT